MRCRSRPGALGIGIRDRFLPASGKLPASGRLADPCLFVCAVSRHITNGEKSYPAWACGTDVSGLLNQEHFLLSRSVCRSRRHTLLVTVTMYNLHYFVLCCRCVACIVYVQLLCRSSRLCMSDGTVIGHVQIKRGACYTCKHGFTLTLTPLRSDIYALNSHVSRILVF